MKTLALITVFTFLYTGVIAQQNIVFRNATCRPSGKVFPKCQFPPTFGNNKSDLQTYLNQQLGNQVSQTNGEMKVQFYIDTTGKTCCDWIDNSANANFDFKGLASIIDNMPLWNAGVQGKEKVFCRLLISLTFEDNKLLVETIVRKNTPAI